MAKRRGTPPTQRGREPIYHHGHLRDPDLQQRCPFCGAHKRRSVTEPYFRWADFHCNTVAWRSGDVSQGVRCQNNVARDETGKWRQ